MKAFFVTALILVASSCLVASQDAPVPEHSDVVVLTESNFEQLTSEGIWFVEFYAPWCGHCKKLAPTWEQLATQLKGKVHVGKVDCTVESNLARQFGIRGFPTLKMIAEGDLREFKGERTLEGLAKFATGGYEDFAATPVPAKLSTVDKLLADTGDAIRTIERIARDKLWYALGVAFIVGLLLGAVIFGGGSSDYKPPKTQKASSSSASSSSSSSGATNGATEGKKEQ